MNYFKQNKIFWIFILILLTLFGIFPKDNDLDDIINKAIDNVRKQIQSNQ